jgi:Restriction endonuclease
MARRLSYEVKEAMVALSGACFWFWSGFHSFLDTCGVSQSLRARYPRESFNKYDLMRNILTDLENAADLDTIQALVSGFYRLRGAVDRDKLDVARAKRMLEEFRHLVGNDPIEAEVKRREQQAARETHRANVGERQSQQRKLEELNASFLKLSSLEDMTSQSRGYKLETLFFDLLRLYEFECSPPYRHSGEQIDGQFRYEKFDYLVEAKWTKAPSKQEALSVFDGKIRGKAQSTRGFFISASGFDENAIGKFSGDAPRIVLMTGEDLALVLSGMITFADAMRAKVDAIVRHGIILLELRMGAR